MRRRAGALLSIEIAILEAGIALRREGQPEFQASAIAREISDRERARSLIAHGTLYRALGRIAVRGLLAWRWEDPGIAAAEARPRRRMYCVTAEGEAALHLAESTAIRATRAHQETGIRRDIVAAERTAHI